MKNNDVESDSEVFYEELPDDVASQGMTLRDIKLQYDAFVAVYPLMARDMSCQIVRVYFKRVAN